jgi:hypothetical protein
MVIDTTHRNESKLTKRSRGMYYDEILQRSGYPRLFIIYIIADK